MDALDLGYDNMKQWNPAIIYATNSGFGAEGEWAERGSFDLMCQAFSGATVSQGGGPSHVSPAVSWPWVPACGSVEPPRRDGEHAQNTGENGGKMGEIRPTRCEEKWARYSLKGVRESGSPGSSFARRRSAPRSLNPRRACAPEPRQGELGRRRPGGRHV